MIELEAFDLSEPESTLIPKMMKNLETVGFFVLKNVNDFDQDELLNTIRAFYK